MNELTAINQSEPEIDWTSQARSAIRQSDTRGTSKLTTRLLGDLCDSLASPMPLETAARLHGITPRQVQRWCESKAPIARIIEQARARGEHKCLTTIAADKSWKAAETMLHMLNREYRGEDITGSRGGISISISVPIPGQVQAGDTPMIDITPQKASESDDS